MRLATRLFACLALLVAAQSAPARQMSHRREKITWIANRPVK